MLSKSRFSYQSDYVTTHIHPAQTTEYLSPPIFGRRAHDAQVAGPAQEEHRLSLSCLPRQFLPTPDEETRAIAAPPPPLV
eukprot:5238677-Prymnesium_polylepis.1